MKEQIEVALLRAPECKGMADTILHVLLDKNAHNKMLECQWTPIKIQELLLTTVARLSATVFVGKPAYHDDAWLDASTKYAEQATMTVFILKTTPVFLRAIVSLALPSYWAASAWVRKGVGILVPIIQARRNAEKTDSNFQRPKDFLQGMIDIANDDEVFVDDVRIDHPSSMQSVRHHADRVMYVTTDGTLKGFGGEGGGQVVKVSSEFE